MDTQKTGRTRRAKKPYTGPMVPTNVIIQRGYIKLSCTFEHQDGTETREEGGWVCDWEGGRLFVAFADHDQSFQGCGWSQTDAIAALKRDFPQVQVLEVRQDR